MRDRRDDQWEGLADGESLAGRPGRPRRCIRGRAMRRVKWEAKMAVCLYCWSGAPRTSRST